MSLTKRFRWRKVRHGALLVYDLSVLLPAQGRKCAIGVHVTPQEERWAIAQKIKHARSVLREAVNEWVP